MKDFLEARQEDYPTKDFFDVGFLNFKKVTKGLPLPANSFYPRDKKETNIRRFFFPSISLFLQKVFRQNIKLAAVRLQAVAVEFDESVALFLAR